MKSTKFAVGGDEAKIAAFGGALAESVLDDASAEERDDSGGDESDDGKPNGDDDSSEVEGAETSFEARYEAILQLIFGSFNPIARSKSTKEDGDAKTYCARGSHTRICAQRITWWECTSPSAAPTLTPMLFSRNWRDSAIA